MPNHLTPPQYVRDTSANDEAVIMERQRDELVFTTLRAKIDSLREPKKYAKERVERAEQALKARKAEGAENNGDSEKPKHD